MAQTAASAPIASDAVLNTFLGLVRIDSPSGSETQVAERLLAALAACDFDVQRDATGNVIGRRRGRGHLAGETVLLLAAHMDTVQPGTGIEPIVEDGIVHTTGHTILGADDKAGITAILEGIRAADAAGQDTVPLEVLFTVEEETGLTGAKRLEAGALVATEGVVLDSNGSVGHIVNQAPAQNSLKAVVHGKAAHAGVSPELGVNALVAAAKAIAAMRLGRLDAETTANIGVIQGGRATNIVPERIELAGEARSRSEAKLEAQTAHMRECLETAAREVGAQVEIEIVRAYAAINVPENAPLVRRLSAAMTACGVTPELVPTGGGSDANILNGRGITALNLGVGYVNPHSVDERLTVAELVQACLVVRALITTPATV